MGGGEESELGPNFPSFWKECFECISLNVGCENSMNGLRGYTEKYRRSLKHGKCIVWRKIMSMKHLLNLMFKHLKKGVHMITSYPHPHARPRAHTHTYTFIYICDQSNSLEKQVKCMCDPLDMNNSIVEYLHNFSCKMCKSQWAS